MKKMAWLGLLLVAGVSFAEASEIKVGYVDLQKAIQSSSAGKKAKAELEAEFNKRKKDIEKKEADIRKMNEDLEKKKAVLSEDAFGKKQVEVQEEMLKYRDLVGKNQMEIQKKERDLTSPILEKLKTIIEDIAKKDQYTMILEKNEQSVLWAKKEIDLTDRVVAELEKAK